MTPDEEWRTIAGYEGTYEVSNLGRVRSLDRTIDDGFGRPRRLVGRVLKQSFDNYAKVGLKLAATKATKNVHQLVAAAFLGPQPAGLDVCHGNGDRSDNRVSNLRYGTRSENMLDSVRHGTHPAFNDLECKRGHLRSVAGVRVWSGKRRCAQCEADRESRRHPNRAA